MATNAQYLASLVNSSGNIVLPVANAGIVFNNTNTTASPTSTTQNDYETGTWSPILNGGSAQTNAGWYIKIGRLVVLGVNNCYASTALATGAQIAITNMPFAVNGGNVSGSAANATIQQVSNSYKDYALASRIYSITSWTVTNTGSYSVTTSDIWNLGCSYYASF